MSGDAPDGRVTVWVNAAFERLEARLAPTPHLAARVMAWLRRLSPTEDPSDYFHQPRLCPILTMPGWVEESLTGTVDDALQRELVYSTIAGYCHIRLLDDVMDGDPSTDATLLPASGFFHAEFTGAYARLFAPGHPFWDAFERLWFGAADAAVADAALSSISLEEFRAVSAQKVAPAKIPLMAVCLHRARSEALPAWLDIADALGEAAQLTDDLLDWQADHARGAATWFLTEAERWRDSAESPVGWILREGFDWGIAELGDRYRVMHRQVSELGSPGLARHLVVHEGRLAEMATKLGPGFRALAALARTMPD